jgi:hypothetical protein
MLVTPGTVTQPALGGSSSAELPVVLRRLLLTSAVTSRARPIEGPPISSHARAIPIRKQTITRAAMVFTP